MVATNKFCRSHIFLNDLFLKKSRKHAFMIEKECPFLRTTNHHLSRYNKGIKAKIEIRVDF